MCRAQGGRLVQRGHGWTQGEGRTFVHLVERAAHGVEINALCRGCVPLEESGKSNLASRALELPALERWSWRGWRVSLTFCPPPPPIPRWDLTRALVLIPRWPRGLGFLIQQYTPEPGLVNLMVNRYRWASPTPILTGWDSCPQRILFYCVKCIEHKIYHFSHG